MFSITQVILYRITPICHHVGKQTLENTGGQRILHSATLNTVGVLRAKSHDMVVRNAPYSGGLRGDFHGPGFFDVLLGVSTLAFLFFSFAIPLHRNAAAIARNRILQSRSLRR